MMLRRNKRVTFRCTCNRGYELSLRRGKIYVALPDRKAARFRMIRVIDESGEDYLFPKDYFVPVRLKRPEPGALNLPQ
jgi:hypothetical protein